MQCVLWPAFKENICKALWALQYPLFAQFVALSLYVIFMGFCFCDGFGLRTSRKLLWFVVFLAFAWYVLNVTGELDLAFILPIPSLLAILICVFQKRESRKKE